MNAWQVTTPSALLGSGATRLAALQSALARHPWLADASLSDALARGVRVTRVS